MTIFYDDFERSNRALSGDNGWLGRYGTCSITGGSITPSVAGADCYQPSLYSGSGRVQADMHYFLANSGATVTGILLKTDRDGVSGFWCAIQNNAGTWRVEIRSGGGSSGTLIGSGNLAAYPGPFVLLSLVWDAGHLVASVNGTERATADSALYSSSAAVGFDVGNASNAVADFRIVTGAAIQFSVAPAAIPNFGLATPLTFTGVGTAWTGGTPGSPVFTCNHGTLSDQTVASTTSATASYNPGDYLGAVVFTDPSTGLTATAVVSSDPFTFPEAFGFFTAAAIEYIERSAIADSENTILNRGTNVAQSGDPLSALQALAFTHSAVADPAYSEGSAPGVNALAAILWQLINGGASPAMGPWPENDGQPVKLDTQALKGSLDTLITSNHWTLGDVITQVTGLGVPTIKDVMDALADLPAGDSSTILEAIAAVRGDGSPDLRTVADILENLRTVHNYDLGDVKGWIDALPQTQAGVSAAAIVALVAALALAAPTGGASVAAAAAAVGAGPLLDLATLVEVMGILSELASIASSINSLAAPTWAGPPIWPGGDRVELGDVVALSNGLELTGPLHGVIVTITEQPEHCQKYLFGDVASWARCGQIIFANDVGAYERSQTFGLDVHLLTPQLMTVASSALVRLNGGWGGTIRPWTIPA